MYIFNSIGYHLPDEATTIEDGTFSENPNSYLTHCDRDQTQHDTEIPICQTFWSQFDR